MSDELDPIEVAAVRRLLWSLAGDDADADGTLMDATEAVVDRFDQLETRVAGLEELVDPDPGSVEYDQLTREQKVHQLRKALLTDAAESNGRAGMKYKEVKALFNNRPSAGHCYDLMERAGDLDGFDYTTNRGDEKVIRVESDAVNDETLLHAVNNEATGTPA